MLDPSIDQLTKLMEALNRSPEAEIDLPVEFEIQLARLYKKLRKRKRRASGSARKKADRAAVVEIANRRKQNPNRVHFEGDAEPIQFQHQQRTCYCCNERKANKNVSPGWLQINNCPKLSQLPNGLSLEGLQVSNLTALKRLPKDLCCRSAIEISGTEIEKVEQEQMRSLQFQFQGVPVPAHAFFEPEKITIEEILGSRNAEVRRMMLQQMGVERFVSQTKQWVVDQDSDPGGKRLLIRFKGRFGTFDRYLLCSCPSTVRVYLMQVPDSVQTCRAAAAWLAGFDNPDDYQPLIET